MEGILREIEGEYDFIEPKPASEDDLERVHTRFYINSVNSDSFLYEVAKLAAGGAIKAAELAMEGEPSFGLIRPPGHHAGANSAWGFCYFNNIAIALAKLQAQDQIKSSLILDFDLHFGDGTNNIFAGSMIRYFQPTPRSREAFIEEIETTLLRETRYHILAVSAGFDRHLEDWGGQLSTEDYRTIGRLIKEAAENNCQGRRFAVLEGGYNHQVLGKNVRSFLEGLE
jgi:acetoin utilization deacetylase AcuC-like enzyme